MSAPLRGLRSFSGDRLTGRNLVRIVYLDEAGVSNPAQEPYLVVAGVMVHGDNDWPKLHDHLETLAKRFGIKSIYDFHAKDIFHGNGCFDRNNPKWPRERRQALLLALASLPQRFKLPVVAGFIHRKDFERRIEEQHGKWQRNNPKFNPAIDRAQFDTLAHGEAFVDAVRSADFWLQNASATEQGLIIVENIPRMHSTLKLVQAVFRDKYLGTQLMFYKARPFKSTRIIETVHFAEKRESPLLQLADICAFTIKRRLMRKADIQECYSAIEPQLVRTKKTSTDWDLYGYEVRLASRFASPE